MFVLITSSNAKNKGNLFGNITAQVNRMGVFKRESHKVMKRWSDWKCPFASEKKKKGRTPLIMH